MTPAQNREKPGVEPGFTAIPNRTAEGLSAWPYSLSSLKLYIYLCRQSWGWRNKATKSCYCRQCIAQATNMHASTVSIALTVLEKARLVEFRSDGRIDLDLKGPEAYRAKVPRCPEHTSLKYEQPGAVAKRPRRRCQTATRALRNGNTNRLHTDVSSSVTSAEKKLLKKEKEIRTSPAPPGAFHKSLLSILCRCEEAALWPTKQSRCERADTSRDCIGAKSAPRNDKRHDPRFREVAVAWIRKCPHEPERAGSVDSWTGRLIQIAERLNVSPHVLIRSVPDGAARPRGYVRGFESGAYPLPAWAEDPAHKQTFYDWLDAPVAQASCGERSRTISLRGVTLATEHSALSYQIAPADREL
jgi:DNA-binding transcriptional ArsR family regulator